MSFRRCAPGAATAALLVVAGPSPAQAHEFYATRVPQAAMAENSLGLEKPCITCHDNADGGAGCVESGGAKPCLNPFGTAFRSNGFQWDEVLALMDADSDGFTNGQELQDPSGTWRPGADPPGVEDYVTRPGFDTESPGQEDADGDRFCWFGRDLDQNGNCLGAGENNGDFDCDDGSATINSGATELCTNTADDDCNGLDTLQDPLCEDVVDRDGDGFCRMGVDNNADQDCIDTGETTTDVDCDDDEITVYPGNRENCADGLDNDCNGRIDDLDDMCRGDVDNDNDGYCPIGRDTNGDGDCLDGSEPSGGFDCDDTNAAVNPGQPEICTDSLDNDCDGDASFEDSECRAFFDEDGDGYCPGGVDQNGNMNCIDPGEDVEPFDCLDTDATVNPGATEMCVNTQDDDCDGDVSLADDDCAGYLDSDGDQYCFVGFDMNRDGDCADLGEEGGSATDCDDTDAAVVPVTGGAPTPEVCTDGLDNNCDGSLDAFDPECRDYRDLDGDAWCAVGEDRNGDADCSDTGEQAGLTDETQRDAQELDSTVYPAAPEHCLDMKDNDQDGLIDEGPLRSPDDYRDVGTACVMDADLDGDGWCPIGQDVNGDGDCLDPGENGAVSDCDETDPERNPGAEEQCREPFDEDCDSQVNLFDSDCFRLLDLDGDGFCGEGIDDNNDGDCLDEAEDRFGSDCDDSNRDINVRAREICDDGLDNDCDGNADAADAQCPCAVDDCDDGDPCTVDACDESGCVYSVAPACADGGLGDGSPDPGSGDDGCGCSTVGRRAATKSSWVIWGALVLGSLWIRRRRKWEV